MNVRMEFCSADHSEECSVQTTIKLRTRTGAANGCSLLMGVVSEPTRLTVLASLLGAFSEFSASDPVSCITGGLTFVIIQALVHNEGRAI